MVSTQIVCESVWSELEVRLLKQREAADLNGSSGPTPLQLPSTHLALDLHFPSGFAVEADFSEGSEAPADVVAGRSL